MNFATMLQAAAGISSPLPTKKRRNIDEAARVAKQRATLAAKKKAKWSGLFAHFGGKAGTNALAAHLGRTAPSILKSLHDCEDFGWVTRAGTILKSGPGQPQIIWEWVAND